jgi:hypothetical protein
MSILSQGTQVYAINPVTRELITIQCATAFNPGGNPADQLEDTCLEAFDRSYKPGLRTPGAATLTLNADPSFESHTDLFDLSKQNPPPSLKWAIGWSDGTAPPTVDSNGNFNLPNTRTWLDFEGYVSDFPFDFQLNSIVSGDVSIQRSGGLNWTRKTA